jgi:hypothetical protein
MRERIYIVRGPKGRAGEFLVGVATERGEWGARKDAIKWALDGAQQYARIYGGTVDAAGWKDVPESPVAGFVSERQRYINRRQELASGAAERAARKDGNFFGAW